jgi:hypothetical protein
VCTRYWPFCRSYDLVDRLIASAGVQWRSPLQARRCVVWSRSCVGSETDSTSRVRVLKGRFARIVLAKTEGLVSDRRLAVGGMKRFVLLDNPVRGVSVEIGGERKGKKCLEESSCSCDLPWQIDQPNDSGFLSP